MQTPSHLIMTAALRKRFSAAPIPTSGFLLGAVAPDVALVLLSIGGGLYYRYVVGLSTQATFRHIFDTMYFKDPIWISLHNLLHSPLLLLVGLLALWRFRWARGTWRQWGFWFLLACLLHSLVDVLTHHDDGPLLFFPLNWTIRFASPVSYWDHRHYGEEFARFELALDLLLLGYLVLPVIWRGLRGRLVGRRPAE